VHTVFEHVVEEVPSDHALAHQAPEPVRNHGEDGVHVAAADQRFESSRIHRFVVHSKPPM
jgi:hypothetical protein